ncbi:NADP-dependent oxidoreductase domain-containing protein [Jimgerdemannia flammicorona]|uniref:NADP-dependent oxidoreductase domain-containing protein n=1 Tax=Jimgerdemannia flammicorona TaxID=994334 RepID=A0A433DL38_9FUNG|nr:NADP-dependent oxidoreductase domain-containing protein [Jimgerdemannia flammicorona]
MHPNLPDASNSIVSTHLARLAPTYPTYPPNPPASESKRAFDDAKSGRGTVPGIQPDCLWVVARALSRNGDNNLSTGQCDLPTLCASRVSTHASRRKDVTRGLARQITSCAITIAPRKPNCIVHEDKRGRFPLTLCKVQEPHGQHRRTYCSGACRAVRGDKNHTCWRAAGTAVGPIVPLAIGCWSWGDQAVWKWTPESEKDAKEAFDFCVSQGIDFFDTAESYGVGESEGEIQRFRESYTDEAKARQTIATKYAPWKERETLPDNLLSALKDSLNRLGMFKADLYQIHGPIHVQEVEVVADALADAHDAGLVKAVGVSNYSLDETRRMHLALQKRGIQLASNQISYSLIRTIPMTSGLIGLCHELGVAVLAYSSLGMGLLTGKFGVRGPFPERREHLGQFDEEQMTQLLDTVERIAGDRGVPMSAVALNWCICKGTIPLAGAKNLHQAEQNAKALGWRLTEEEVAELDKYSFVGSNNEYWQHG